MSSRAVSTLPLIGLVTLLALPAGATTFTPTKFTDSFDGACNADCSLREAIQAANQMAGADEIVLAAGTYQLSRAGAGEDANATGDLDLSTQITIMGQGARRTLIDGGDLDRIFHILPSGSVQLVELTVQNGMADSGGGLLVRGVLTLLACQIQNNVASGFGGGLNADFSGSLFVLNSTFFDNSAFGGGGAVLGIDSEFHNTTFSANTATDDFGGGLYVFSLTEVLLLNLTFTGNMAMIGGGLLVEGGSMVSMANSILSGNSAAIGPECSGNLASQGHNLLKNNSLCGGFTGMGDLVGTSGSPLDALLGPLANNGSGTDSHRPLATSPVLEAGSTGGLGDPGACTSEDQRAVLRPLDRDGNGIARCDIGAIEDDTIFGDGFESGNTSAWSTTVP